MLRDYQTRSINNLYDWFRDHSSGNPCLVLPTGSGKSWIIAALCRDALTQWPETKVLMLTHVKELIEQNAEKMRAVWPGAPMGIYSASVGKRQLGEPITFAGIQSVRKKSDMLGHIDLILIDECHLVSHKDEGGYRELINALTLINPHIRVIGLTATPWRLGHGLITDGDALFDALLEPVSIEELIYKGFLAPLRSKLTKTHLDTSGVHKRGGEYIDSELQAAVNTADQNARVVQEVIALAGERKAWLFFCAGVDHAEAVAEMLRIYNIEAQCITGATSKHDREVMIADFKAGRIRALTNANVLTTGFDYPDIDLIAMLRPTLSPSLYVQMAGRGMRPKSHTDHCLVLDFAGVVETHGPITAVQPPTKSGETTGEAPVKVCESCDELCHLSVRECPACGAPFPVKEAPTLSLRNIDIMGLEPEEMIVTGWSWRKHTSRTSGKDMLKVTYYGALSDEPVSEYLTVLHQGVAGQRAMRTFSQILDSCGVALAGAESLEDAAKAISDAQPPAAIKFRKEGKFYNVQERSWNIPQNKECEGCVKNNHGVCLDKQGREGKTCQNKLYLAN